jgi:hypothetical protein
VLAGREAKLYERTASTHDGEARRADAQADAEEAIEKRKSSALPSRKRAR